MNAYTHLIQQRTLRQINAIRLYERRTGKDVPQDIVMRVGLMSTYASDASNGDMSPGPQAETADARAARFTQKKASVRADLETKHGQARCDLDLKLWQRKAPALRSKKVSTFYFMMRIFRLTFK